MTLAAHGPPARMAADTTLAVRGAANAPRE